MENLCSEDKSIYEESLEFIRFWINSIGLHAVKSDHKIENDPGSPMILIGTHMDIISDAEAHKKINELFKDEFRYELKTLHILENKSESLIFFPVDNSNPADPNISNIRKIIEERKLSEDPKTLDELSKKYKISRERIRQIETKAFEKLQKAMLNSSKSKNLLPAK